MEEELETIEVSLSEEDQVSLIKMFVERRMSNSAKQTFAAELQHGVEHAISWAIINEMVLEAVTTLTTELLDKVAEVK